MSAEKYIRVGTTLFKIVRKPLQSGDFIEMRIPWNYDTLTAGSFERFYKHHREIRWFLLHTESHEL